MKNMFDYENVLDYRIRWKRTCLGWKISKNQNIKKIFYANGNEDTSENLKFSQ